MHRRDQFYPITGKLSRPCLSSQTVGHSNHLPETDAMNSDLSAPSASTPARDELARRVLESVCHPAHHPADELAHWLRLVEGTAGFLHGACDDAQFFHRDIPCGADDIAALAGLLQRSTAICRILADGIRGGGL